MIQWLIELLLPSRKAHQGPLEAQEGLSFNLFISAKG